MILLLLIIRNDPDPDKLNTYYMRLSWSQTSEMLELCQLLYSAGEEMEVVVAETQQMLDRFHRHFDQDFFERKLFLRESDSYTYILWLLGLAILVNDKTNLMRIPHWIGEKDWGDPIPYVDPPMKSLLNFLGYQGVVTVSEQAFFPKSVYPKLAQIISAQHSWQREELLQAYLKIGIKLIEIPIGIIIIKIVMADTFLVIGNLKQVLWLYY